MKIKTSELSGAALDWAVAKLWGLEFDKRGRAIWFDSCGPNAERVEFHPTNDWAQGGPIIERKRLLVQPEIGKDGAGDAWSAISLYGNEQYGPTPLIAAMRCFVASELGDEVDVPDELCERSVS